MKTTFLLIVAVATACTVEPNYESSTSSLEGSAAIAPDAASAPDAGAGDGLTVNARCVMAVPYLSGQDDKNVTASLGEVKWMRFDPPVNGSYRVGCRIIFQCTRQQSLSATCPAGTSVVRVEPECAASVNDYAGYEWTIDVNWAGDGQPNAVTAQQACEGFAAAMNPGYRCWYAKTYGGTGGVTYVWNRPNATDPFDVVVSCVEQAPPPRPLVIE